MLNETFSMIFKQRIFVGQDYFITVGEVVLFEALTSPGKVCGRGLLDLDLDPDPDSG